MQYGTILCYCIWYYTSTNSVDGIVINVVNEVILSDVPKQCSWPQLECTSQWIMKNQMFDINGGLHSSDRTYSLPSPISSEKPDYYLGLWSTGTSWQHSSPATMFGMHHNPDKRLHMCWQIYPSHLREPEKVTRFIMSNLMISTASFPFSRLASSSWGRTVGFF